ncbi:tRNA lysidine(34) synthetase TilS [Kamptonema cortianum]|nr:tRNA lysidine(34) synthetase TilS [Oscillatoria laete-virens]MDK3160234.1 tRNA lysidine(34) synthetase TilS [Kamptonema cortianum]MDL5048412.1 tRNA lysidine(34) synthetase TilS [Oscillatoria amoena NRMC-F 0135]MDL5055676.1 tRNA lysidine(34) synthetase TilS [Oscillatoria laete-virens NRMC-F 0139]
MNLAISKRRLPALVAVSGGLDSVVLLHLLAASVSSRKLLRVAHFNHKLRGADSDADEAFVRALAKKLKIPISVGRADVRQMARRKKLSIETAARESRYAFFERLAQNHQIRHLHLAHHADDQIETFLHRLFRGTGVAGLTGMKPVAKRGKLLLHRPLLGVAKKQLEEFARAEGLTWREDRSNLRTEHTRNRIRHELIPLARDIFQRDISGSLHRLIEILTAENEHLTPPGVPPKILKIPELTCQPLALQRRIIHQWLASTHRIPMPDFDEVESVRSLIESRQSRCRVNLKKGFHVKRSRGTLKVEKGKI